MKKSRYVRGAKSIQLITTVTKLSLKYNRKVQGKKLIGYKGAINTTMFNTL